MSKEYDDSWRPQFKKCKICNGEYLTEYLGDVRVVCPDCRPGISNRIHEEVDTFSRQQNYYNKRLREGFRLLRSDGDDN